MLIVCLDIPPDDLFVSNLQILQSVRFGMPVRGTLLPPFRIYRPVQVFNHVRPILRRLFYIHCISRHKPCLLAEPEEILDTETVSRISIPVTFIRRTQCTITNHVLKTVFGSINHRTSIAQETQPLIHHCLPDIITQRQPTKLSVGTVHQSDHIYQKTPFPFQINGKACVFIGLVRNQLKCILFPVTGLGTDTLYSIFFFTIHALKGYPYFCLPFQIKATGFLLTLTYGDPPAIQAPVGNAHFTDTCQTLYLLSIVSMKRFVRNLFI